jgi:hypothetical protein
MSSKTKWPTVTRERPCPICSHSNRCLIAPDGLAALCWRNGGKVQQVGRGQNRNGQHRVSDPAPTRPKQTHINADEAIKAAGKSIKGGKLVTVWNYPGDVARVARFNLNEHGKESSRSIREHYPLHEALAG